jgi:hypothetical protein
MGLPVTEYHHDPTILKFGSDKTQLGGFATHKTDLFTLLTQTHFYTEAVYNFIFEAYWIKITTTVTMPTFSASTTILTIAIILFLARPAHAFGAGNIGSVSKVEGVNCELLLHLQQSANTNTWIGRHGDIEDTLLKLFMARAAGGKKFSKMNVARVYFGNWLRDYCELIISYMCLSWAWIRVAGAGIWIYGWRERSRVHFHKQSRNLSFSSISANPSGSRYMDSGLPQRGPSKERADATVQQYDVESVLLAHSKRLDRPIMATHTIVENAHLIGVDSIYWVQATNLNWVIVVFTSLGAWPSGMRWLGFFVVEENWYGSFASFFNTCSKSFIHIKGLR